MGPRAGCSFRRSWFFASQAIGAARMREVVSRVDGAGRQHFSHGPRIGRV